MNNFRKGIDYPTVTCVFYCHDGKGNYLLHKRSEKCKDEQERWDCGGGAIEFGEEFEDCVKREIKEEYGCNALKIEFAGVSNVLRKNREGISTHWIALVYKVQVDSKQAILGDPDKMMELAWFKKESFPEPLHSQFIRHFELIKKLN